MNLVPWILPVALLAMSALFSSAETSLFGLGERPAGPRVARLLEQPRETLVTILIGNLFVNVSFFAVLQDLGRDDPVVTGLGALAAILLCGEILPKSIALRAAPRVARLIAPPVLLTSALLRPVRRGVEAFLEVALRALGEDTRSDTPISPQALEEALNKSAREGVLTPGESDLLAEIVELSSLRVREIMTPRVEMLMLDLEDDEADRRATLGEAVQQRKGWLPVVRGEADTIVGMVRVRDLLAHPERSVEQAIMPAAFVPEVAPVLSMLNTLRVARVAEAVVVDEWGGTAGVVTLENLFEEVVGDLRVEDEEPEKPLVALGEGRYRVAGDLSIRDWNELLDRDVVPHEFETVGGFVLATLGRMPRVGDEVELGGGLVGEVSEVRGRRVWTVDLYVRREAEGAR